MTVRGRRGFACLHPPLGEGARGRGPIQQRILIVDDEQPVRYTLRRLLEGAGHRIVEADSAELGLETAGAERPDLVITDLKMPGADGLSLAQQLLQDDPSRPVMLMTGYADVDSARRALQMGVYEYFTKPVDTNEVLVRVERALERRRLVLDNVAYQRELERRLQERTKQLEEAHAQQMKAARLAVVGELASAVGREVMNPLSVVGGRIDMVLMRGAVDDTDRACLESARKGLGQVTALLSGLRAYERGDPRNALSEDMRRKLRELVNDDRSSHEGGEGT